MPALVRARFAGLAGSSAGVDGRLARAERDEIGRFDSLGVRTGRAVVDARAAAADETRIR